MAVNRPPSNYMYKRKVVAGKGNLQKSQDQGIIAQMIYYMSEARLRGKIRRINDALEEDPVAIETLKTLAITGDGLITTDLRCRVWPKLLNVNVYEITKPPKRKKDDMEVKQFKSHKYWNQVNLDVDRSHRRFPTEMRASRRRALQAQLVNVIMRVLVRNPDLHYYQGYHDIAVTFLLVTGEDLATALLEQLSLHALRDFMDHTMEKTNKMLAFMHPIIKEVDPELEDFLERSEVGQLFALSWLITWFGHVVKDFNTIVRLCDFFLATHPLMPVYLSAALVIKHRDDVILGECEMSFVHHTLSKITDDLPSCAEDVIQSSYSLFKKYSPEKMASAAEKYLRESTALKKHTEFIRELENQRPDSVLRRRRQFGRHGNELIEYKGTHLGGMSGPPNTYVKMAVWALTASVGTVALYILSTTKRWI